MITFDAETQCFHLRGAQVSYVMQVEEDGQVHHLYWGDALRRETGAASRVPCC